MKARKAVERWERTSVQNMVQSKSGTYYARICVGKGQKWKSLKTAHLRVAKARLREHLAEHAEQAETQAALVTGKLSLHEAAELHLQKLKDARTLKLATRHYWEQVVKALLKSWPTASERDVRSITAKECQDWG